METPLDLFCLKSGTFCPSCEAKIRSGRVIDLDIKVMKVLLDLEKRFPVLQGTGFVKAVETDDILAVVLREGDLAKIQIRALSSLARDLSRELGKNVRFIEDVADNTAFLESLVSPGRIVTVNRIWLPDGFISTRIILDDVRRLKISKESLIEIARKVKGISLRVDFDRRRKQLARARHKKRRTAKNPRFRRG